MTNTEMIESHMGHRGSDRDIAINQAARQILLDAGVRQVGQRIDVLKGRHTGFRGEIETINWTEAEVQCKGNPRWFGLWQDRNYFKVFPADIPTGENSHKPPSISQPTAPSWIPKPKTTS